VNLVGSCGYQFYTLIARFISAVLCELQQYITECHF